MGLQLERQILNDTTYVRNIKCISETVYKTEQDSQRTDLSRD